MMITQKISRLQALGALFKAQLQDLYWAEKYLLERLETIVPAATSVELTAALDQFRSETDRHVQRLELVFELVGERSVARKCEAMEGLLREAEELVSDTEEGSLTRDAALILAMQKIAHYEIASYGTLAALGILLRYREAGRMLDLTLEEVKNADRLLTEVAEGFVNEAAKAESE